MKNKISKNMRFYQISAPIGQEIWRNYQGLLVPTCKINSTIQKKIVQKIKRIIKQKNLLPLFEAFSAKKHQLYLVGGILRQLYFQALSFQKFQQLHSSQKNIFQKQKKFSSRNEQNRRIFRASSNILGKYKYNDFDFATDAPLFLQTEILTSKYGELTIFQHTESESSEFLYHDIICKISRMRVEKQAARQVKVNKESFTNLPFKDYFRRDFFFNALYYCPPQFFCEENFSCYLCAPKLKEPQKTTLSFRSKTINWLRRTKLTDISIGDFLGRIAEDELRLLRAVRHLVECRYIDTEKIFSLLASFKPHPKGMNTKAKIYNLGKILDEIRFYQLFLQNPLLLKNIFFNEPDFFASYPVKDEFQARVNEQDKLTKEIYQKIPAYFLLTQRIYSQRESKYSFTVTKKTEISRENEHKQAIIFFLRFLWSFFAMDKKLCTVSLLNNNLPLKFYKSYQKNVKLLNKMDTDFFPKLQSPNFYHKFLTLLNLSIDEIENFWQLQNEDFLFEYQKNTRHLTAIQKKVFYKELLLDLFFRLLSLELTTNLHENMLR